MGDKRGHLLDIFQHFRSGGGVEGVEGGGCSCTLFVFSTGWEERRRLIMMHTHRPKCIVSLVGSVEDVGTCLRMGGEMNARLVQGSVLFLGLG